MNQRILELARQVWPDPNTSHVNHEKFAELIVRECMQQVEEQYKPILEDETMMKDIRWAYYVDCGVDSYVAIREHFFGEEL